MAKKRAIEILTEDEDDYVQPGYEDTDDPTQATDHWERGQGAHLGVAKVPRRLLCTPFRMPMVVPHRRPPSRDFKGVGEECAAGPSAGPTWIPNLGTAEIALKSEEGFSFKVRFCVASVQRALLRATQVLKLGHTIILKGSRAVIHVKGDAKKALVFKINGSPKATFFFKDFPRHCVEEGR